MINEMHFQRLRDLGHFEGAKRRDPRLSGPRLGEPSGKERLENPKAYSGNHFAMEVLPPLGLTFDSLRTSCLQFKRPALDVGASVSTVAAEGALRGIEIHSTELPPIRNRERFIESIRNRLLQLGEVYQASRIFPKGFECEAVSSEVWESRVHAAISRVNETLVECAAGQILGLDYKRAPDQSYSTVFSHHGVPKYCSTESFFERELPELLRVAADRVHLFPLRSAGPDDEILHREHSQNYRRMSEIANAAGFSFQTHRATHLVVDPEMPPPQPGFETTAIFIRQMKS